MFLSKISGSILAITTFSFSLAAHGSEVAEGQRADEVAQDSSSSFKIDPMLAVSYERVDIDAKGAEPLAGYGIGAVGKMSFGEQLGLLPFVSVGGSWMSIGNAVTYNPLPGLTQELSSDLISVAWSAAVGAGLKVTNEIGVEMGVGYVGNITGKMVLTEKSSNLETSLTKDLAKLRHVNIGAKGTYALTSELTVGADVNYKAAGAIQEKDGSENKYTGFSVGLGSQYSF
jgi:hypothetical protein